MKALFRILAAVAATAIIIDQATKLLVRQSLEVCTVRYALGCDRLDPAGPLQLIRLRNAGSAFGFFQNLWVWVPLAFASLLLVLVYVRTGRVGAILALAAGLQFGGAMGNLVDRVVLGDVTDFIYLGAGPVFNLADVALAIGTILASWSMVSGFSPTLEPLRVNQTS